MAVDLGRQGADDRARVGVDEHRCAGGLAVDDGGAGLVGEHGDGSGGDGLGGELGPVTAEAGQGDEELAVGDVAGVHAHPGDAQRRHGLRVTLGGGERAALGEVGERRGTAALRAQRRG